MCLVRPAQRPCSRACAPHCQACCCARRCRRTRLRQPDAGAPSYDVLISGGTIYDGSGGAAFTGDVGIKGDRIAYVGPHAPGSARERFDAHGKAVAPGFVNMLAHPEVSLLHDGRALSDLRQGVTLEVLGEDSMGPLRRR